MNRDYEENVFNKAYIHMAVTMSSMNTSTMTNGPQNGPRLYTLSQTPTYDLTPKTEGFVARHFKGT